MKPVVSSTCEHKSGRNNNDRIPKRGIPRTTERDPMQGLVVVESPCLRSKNPQTSLHKRMIQVRQDNIISSLCDLVVEGDWATLESVRVI